jgi:hypothetical protein
MRDWATFGALLLAAIQVACSGASPSDTAQASKPSDATVVKLREDALAAAKVWTAPAASISQANLRDNPAGPGGFAVDAEVDCRFKIQDVNGTTPKFYCELPNGEVVKIKYGGSNPELPSEVAATRLLATLGFGADRMYVVKRIRCAGCPSYPFYALLCLRDVGVKSVCLPGGIDYDRVVNFDSVVVERRLEGRKIESPPTMGWTWFELEKIDPARGGSSRTEVDALRLLAMLLAHWDNKADNQRLFCPPADDRPDGSCARPVAILQDVGATFGPTKLDLHNWRNTRIWADGASCTVSMKTLPFSGATFPDSKITEGGRKLLLGLLEQLSDQQLRDLFEGSRITAFDQVSGEGRNADAWVRVFKDKVKQIREGGPCPQ